MDTRAAFQSLRSRRAGGSYRCLPLSRVEIRPIVAYTMSVLPF